MKPGDPAHLQQFSESVKRYKRLMAEAAEGIRREDVSKYPIFIFHQQEVNVGLILVDRDISGGEWSVNLSTLEEFYIKGLVRVDQLDEIKGKIAGTPPAYCCLVISPDGGSLVFVDAA